MKACGTDACNQGRGAICAAGCDDEVMAAQAGGARMCGAWPYLDTPTNPGRLTEAELDMHNREFHGAGQPRPAIFDADESPLIYLPTPTRRERFARWLRNFWDGLVND